jgi:hypothetical protein
MSQVEEKARVEQLKAEAWKSRASAFANVMLGLLYGVVAYIFWKLGSLIYMELR